MPTPLPPALVPSPLSPLPAHAAIIAFFQDVTCEEDNPYKLACGQRIKIVSVETITPDLAAAGIC